MFSWFKKRKSDKEVTPGGSEVYRHGGDEFSKTQMGFASESTADFAVAREKAYEGFFGSSATAYHEVIPFVPHVDVYTYPPGHNGRDFYTLVTSGMSDLEMTLPQQATKAPKRVELVFYCSEPKDEYLEVLRRLAHFPHDNKTWLGSGHTMPNGNPPIPIWGSTVLDSFAFIPTILKPDGTLPCQLVLDGQAVHFLWVVPLTTPECDLKLKKGIGAILDLFDKHRHPHVFDAGRESYV